MASKVTDTDTGYRRLMITLARFRGGGVFVGVPENAGTGEGGATIAQIAAFNEFGTADGHVPERSFLRSTLIENRKKYETAFGRELGKLIDGKRKFRDVLGAVGFLAERDVKRKIRSLREPANAASTIRQKGSSNPLIDTGRMRSAIRHVVVIDGKSE